MTDEPVSAPPRPSRLQLPYLVAGLVIGGLIVGGLAPLVGSDRSASVSSTTPDFLSGGNRASGGGGTDGASEVGTPGGSSDVVSSGTSGSVTGSSTRTAGATASGSGGTEATVPRTASDIGVTADTIRVGTLTLNCKACAALGVSGLDSTPQSSLVKAFVDDINARGGINGRKLELFTHDYDPAQDAVNGGGTEREGCIDLTENRKVFAVMMGGTFTNACIYDEHKTPLITSGDPAADDPATFNRAEGRLWMLNPTSARTLLDWARQIDRQGLMNKSTKFGIVVTDGPQRQQVDKYLVPELSRLGYTPVQESVIPNDYAQAPVKTASEVPAMRGKGATVVLMAADYVVAQDWIRESERNGWKPQYLQSDFPSGANDYSGGQNSQAGDWSGAIAVSSTREFTSAEIRKDPTAKPCFDIYERERGGPTSDPLVGWVLNYCNTYRIFEMAATRAGTNLTRRGFIQALASLGQFPFAGAFANVGTFGGTYSLGPVLWSASTQAQRKVWRKPCPHPESDTDGCYVPEGPIYRMAA